ncbi:uncharacterized protein LOC142162287 [Nicotiana tabacum]|uniref:Uncharacterized protein LOC142162287 n=1 Tax=Nicotiana tabacum TaxID=4097 RepID=A0AC58RPS4_TOBAC
MEQILQALAFPEQFIRWIMTCMETVTYTIMINGALTKPFDARKGLREDIGSIKILFQCFMEFSKASGLQINKNKSSIFFGGVTNEEEEEILAFIGIQRGVLPVRYLGRIQLIKSVLFSIQTYWAQIFVLPKKITKLIEAICRSFLWMGEGKVSKKALLAWDKVCLPKSAGGFNIMNIAIWNKAAICKIMKTHRTMMEAGFSQDDITNMNSCSIKHIYHKLRGTFEKVSWRKVVCHNGGCPRWKFVLTMTAHGRLYTKDRLQRWGMAVDQDCILCNNEKETIQYLFFECSYSKTLWSKLLEWQGIDIPVQGWKRS